MFVFLTSPVHKDPIKLSDFLISQKHIISIIRKGKIQLLVKLKIFKMVRSLKLCKKKICTPKKKAPYTLYTFDLLRKNLPIFY